MALPSIVKKTITKTIFYVPTEGLQSTEPAVSGVVIGGPVVRGELS